MSGTIIIEGDDITKTEKQLEYLKHAIEKQSLNDDTSKNCIEIINDLEITLKKYIEQAKNSAKYKKGYDEAVQVLTPTQLKKLLEKVL